MTVETQLCVAFTDTPEFEELMAYAEILGVSVESYLDYADYPALRLEKTGYPLMEVSLLEEGDNPIFDWAVEPGDELFTGECSAVKQGIKENFSPR